jgi:anti-sigma factor RsiW
MSCEEARALLPAYIDGELDLVHSIEMEKHLEGCLTCTRLVENQQTLRSAIQSTPLHFQPSAALGKRIDAALRGAARTGEPPKRAAWPWIALAASVLLAAVLAGRLPLGLRSAPDGLVAQEILDSHLRSLLPGHLIDVQSSDRHTVKPWFNGRVDFSPPVEDFAAQGFALTGGRLDSVSGHTVAALVYQRRQHSINLYIWPSTAANSSSSTTTTRQGYNLIHWTQAGLNYWLSSDLNLEELQALVALLRGH